VENEMKKFIIIALVFLICVTTPVFGKIERDQALENEISAVFAKDKLAGMSACVIKNNEVVWQWAHGWADIENKIPVTVNTLFMLASVSKTITGATLLHLYDKGKFSLDEDIDDFLPFKIRNPKYPDEPITFRMLFNHTSTLNDDFEIISPLYGDGDVTSPPLEELVRGFFTPGGKYYKQTNFIEKKPGQTFHYSNLNYVVIAYLVELLSKESFSSYCKKNILNPLNMKNSSWFLSDLNQKEVAVHYKIDENQEKKLKRVRHYGWPGYADGCFRSSIPQYTNFIKMLMNDGVFDGKRVLSSKTIAEMFTAQKIKDIPPEDNALPMVDRALTWRIIEMSGQKYFVHLGGGTGITTLVLIDPIKKSGIIWFCTGEAETPVTYLSIFNLLIEKLAE
jgi:CubicO group peptidase (beta-lactamase class C family)